MGPDGLNALSVCHPNAIHIGEVKLCLTWCSVANEVEFWDRNTERLERLDIEGWCGAIVSEATA